MLPPLERAKLSACALASSIKIEEGIAHEILAQTFGYETWQHYASSATLRAPDKLDSELNPDIANHRLELFTEQLMTMLDNYSHAIRSLAKAISPYSIDYPRPHRVELLNKELQDDEFSLKGLLESVGGDDGMLAFIHRMADENPELADLKRFDSFSDFEDALRSSAPVDPACYLDALDNLTEWDIDEALFEECHQPLEPSVYLVSSLDGVSYPVYITSLMVVPGDSNDKLFDSLRQDIEDQSSRALLLFKTCSFKEIEGLTYVVIGTFYDGKSWSWTLLTDDDPETQAHSISPDNFDLESPVLGSNYKMRENQGAPESIVYHAIVSGKIDDSGKLKIPKEQMTVKGFGGWCQFVF